MVLDGGKFEDRFNQLRKVRQKHKNGTVERPFSRMHNFYLLEQGDKWAKTGTLPASRSALSFATVVRPGCYACAFTSTRKHPRVTQHGHAGTIFRPKKASYAPAGYQDDHVDVMLPRKRSISTASEADAKAPESQGLAALTGDSPMLPNSPQSPTSTAVRLNLHPLLSPPLIFTHIAWCPPGSPVPPKVRATRPCYVPPLHGCGAA